MSDERVASSGLSIDRTTIAVAMVEDSLRDDLPVIALPVYYDDVPTLSTKTVTVPFQPCYN